ncbi:ABC transporter permease [Nocardioides sp. SYSU D00038]|uniref:ABC transporter permease n=1 Tax=Nocardioides sp. SYSU D00038 TaxID=2812554 RepID=UPI0019687725|nr:ABC transporter permease [Nocardioides sp. SYSU D00038]
MTGSVGLHLPTVRGRLRADRWLLLLVAAVVGVTVALVGAVPPVGERAADRAMAAAVRDAGQRGTVVATLPQWYDDPAGKTRDSGTATQLRQDAHLVREAMPRDLAQVLRPGVVSVTTTSLQLLDAGPGRYLQLAFVEAADGGPRVSYTQGGPPRAAPAGRGQPPVQVAVSAAAARALDLEVGDRIATRDEHGRSVDVEVSGAFEPGDEGDEVWQVAAPLLHPTTGGSGTERRTSAAALVSPESLPDLRLALPGDALRRRVVFAPEAAAVTWRRSASVERTVATLQSGAALGLGETTWDSLLGTVVRNGRAQVRAAQGQAQVLLVGSLVTAGLVLVLAGRLLVRRRTGSLRGARERGAGLPGIAAELVVESLLVAALGAATGLAVVRLVAGSVGWAWSVPVLVVATVAPAVLGVAAADAPTFRVPANRSARRTRARAAQLRRLGLELTVLAAAALSVAALRQRGVVGDGAGGGDLTAAGAVTWVPLAGAVVLVRLAPPALRWMLRRTRRAVGAGPLLVAARLVRSGTRALPVLAVVVAVSATTFGAALAVTLHDGQAEGARSVVGGDARLDARPDPTLASVAREVADATGVRAAAAVRIEDGVRVSAHGGSAFVRLAVVDAAAYDRLLRASELPDAPRLTRLRPTTAERVPALLRGGPEGLRDDPTLRWEDASVPLQVVGTAPDVGGSTDPVLVVDAEALAAAGVAAAPDAVWAVGPGAARALDAAAARTPGSAVTTYAAELERRRGAALPSAMVRLATASGAVLVVLALLAVALATSVDAPARTTALGRLRALGASDRDLRRTLLGEVVTPVLVAASAGLVIGVGCAWTLLASLSLDNLTGAPEPPGPVVPWWTAGSVVLLSGCAVTLALLDWHRVRRTPLARLLRT